MLTVLVAFVMVESDLRGQTTCWGQCPTGTNTYSYTNSVALGACNNNAQGGCSFAVGNTVNIAVGADRSFAFGENINVTRPESFLVGWNGNPTLFATDDPTNGRQVGLFTDVVNPLADFEIENGNWVQDYGDFPQFSGAQTQWIASSNDANLFPFATGIGLHHQWNEYGSNIGLIERPSSTVRDMIIAFGDDLASGSDGSAATSNRLIFSWRYSTGANELMTLLASGRIGIGTSTPGYQLEITGNAAKPGGGTWVNSSDARLKQNVQKYNDGLEQVLNIKPVSYQYNGKLGLPTDETYIGILAQDMQEVAPYMIEEKDYGEEGTYLTYDGTALPYMLVNAVQEMHALYTEEKEKRQQLEEQVSMQDERIANLEAKVGKLLGSNTSDNELDINNRGNVKEVTISNISIEEPMLFQNEPNPFSGSTTIRFYIPEKATTAEIIIISTENGQLIKRVAVGSTGMGTLNVNADNVAAGSYTYTLIIDGKQSLSRQMIIGN